MLPPDQIYAISKPARSPFHYLRPETFVLLSPPIHLLIFMLMVYSLSPPLEFKLYKKIFLFLYPQVRSKYLAHTGLSINIC